MSDNKKPVRTRFAPSPTGYLHVGGARTALFSWLYARRHGGTFVLRIEDTDMARSTVESIQAILDGMAWLGLDYDEGPYYQSQRMKRYQEVLKQLLESGHAYRCYCSKARIDALREAQMAAKEKPRYDGHCRDLTEPPSEGAPSVIRFRTPQSGEVVFHDQIRGEIRVSNAELDDLVLARTDGVPTYNFTVVVDDWDMEITHVIRGDDHINNTPRQINILKALGADLPIYAHVPMILGGDGKRLSKRHGAVSVMQYRDAGFLPQAMLNYLVRLGWSHHDQEIFSRDEMMALFNLDAISHSAASFNEEKLTWLNQHYLKSADPHVIAPLLAAHFQAKQVPYAHGPSLESVIEIQRDRTKTLEEMAERSLYFYTSVEAFDEKAAAKNLKPDVLPALQQVRDAFAALNDWEAAALHQVIIDVAERNALKLGKLAQPIRVAMTGNTVSPPIDITLALIGREQVLQRLDKAIAFISASGHANV